MSKILEVLNRKSVELKSEVVEFGAIDDLIKNDDRLANTFSDATIARNKIKEAAKEASKKFQNSRKEAVEQLKIVNKIEAKLKDLGLETPSNVERFKSNAQYIMKKADELIGDLKNIG